MTMSFAELLEQSSSNNPENGDLLIGTVVAIDKEAVIVDAGLKSESPIPLSQFMGPDGKIEVAVGDQVEVFLDSLEDGFGVTRLSREKAKRARSWERLEAAQEANETVQGFVTGKVKGGLMVEIDNVKGFLPGSLVDIRPVRDFGFLEGTTVDVKIVKMDKKRVNVVVSRRAVIEAESSAEREALLSNMEEGSVVKGVVKNLTDYGAFLDLGGIDGLLHITDMAWKRVNHPSEVVQIGQEIDVKILKYDRDKNRVSLGLKQLDKDPWRDLVAKHPAGSVTRGKVANITDYGAFVEIEEGIEGLVHTSELDWTNRNIHPSKVVQLGDDVAVRILEIDQERRRISLSLKQALVNPWVQFAETHQKGDRVSGAIKSITDFGVFIGLDGGIDGLIHLTDLSWNEPGEQVIRNLKKGDELDTVILAIDPERERISLGVKQLAQDPFSQFVATNGKGAVVEGVVKEIVANGAVIDLVDEVEGFLRINEVSNENRVEKMEDVMKVGDKVSAKIISVDRKTRRLNLSIKAKDAEERERALQSYSASNQSSSNTLGDLIKDQL